MSTLDWVVLVISTLYFLGYGLYRSRGTESTHGYLLGGKTLPWYAVGLSIMATQASAITFISTTGQGYADGMRFVQFYFGLPLAMILISVTAVPAFHKANVYTAYEYLERRFDRKTRYLTSVIFLLQRGLGAGIALYAPSVVLSLILGWDEQAMTVVMGVVVVIFTVVGGVKAIAWSDMQQMLVIFFGLVLSLAMVVYLLPQNVSFTDALRVAGAAGRVNPVVTTFDLNDRYNVWSGLIGGMFLALAYFGTDQSQVQRYLSGRSIAQSRLSLIFNAVAKIPMQFFILLIGVMVFSFHVFIKPPVLFQPADQKKLEATADYQAIQQRFDSAFEARRQAAFSMLQYSGPTGDSFREIYKSAQRSLDEVRRDAAKAVGQSNDVNYIFLRFVTHYLPVGVVGLLISVVFAAAMSTIAGEVNSLATVTVMDLYRTARPEASDAHYLNASRLATLFWGVYAVGFASFGSRLGSLIEAVNIVGSLFYGGMLGVFVLAFYVKRASATGAFVGVLAGEAAIFYCFWFTKISFLWYNVIGCLVVILVGYLLSGVSRRYSTA